MPPTAPDIHEGGVGEDPTLNLHTPVTDVIEAVNVSVGEFVAYWAVIAVFVYYYEVMARFVFNSPTNWVHESMFLMFGMQYMLSGAYAYREDQHVRVDVLYAKFSPARQGDRRHRHLGVLLHLRRHHVVDRWRFAMDAVQLGEHSFTEWGVQYWPVKLTMPIGAALLLLQGIAKLIKDIVIVTRKGA